MSDLAKPTSWLAKSPKESTTLLSHYFISSYDIPVMAAVVVMKKDATYLECQID